MTLFKQMAITLTIFLNIILITTMLLNFKTVTTFAQEQLYANAQNTAHSLGLSLSKIVDPSDMAGIKATMNAIYDSGYYERIALFDLDGKPLYLLENDVSYDNVPAWFISMITIKNTSATSDIMMGWSRFGTLEVRGHRGIVYAQLYGTLLNLFQIFTLIGLSALIFLYFLLAISLKSLKQIQKQAQGIMENRFIVEEKFPFTVEFRSITYAMNTMVGKVKDIFDRENKTLVQYQQLLYRDTQTKLFNRRYLDAKLPDYLQGDATLSEGLQVMFEVENIERYRQEQGFEAYQAFLNKIVSTIEKSQSKNKDSLIVRLSQSDFFLLLPMAKIDETKHNIDEILLEMSDYLKQEKILYINIFACIGAYSSQDSLKTLLSKSDFMISQAKQSEEFGCVVEPDTKVVPTLSKDQWRRELLYGFDNNNFLLAKQDVVQQVDDFKSIFHQEVFVKQRLSDGKIQAASNFIGMASALGLLDRLDKYVIEKVLSSDFDAPLAINLSGDFVIQASNLEWLKNRLETFAIKNKRSLSFEVSNFVAVNHIESIAFLSNILKKLGHNIGIDNFNLPEEGAHYLQVIRPDYVKVNTFYLQDLMINDVSGKSQEGFKNIAHSLGILIIATNVEEQTKMEILQKNGIQYFQGNYICEVSLFL